MGILGKLKKFIDNSIPDWVPRPPGPGPIIGGGVDLHNLGQSLTNKIAAKLGGDRAEGVMADLHRITTPLPVETAQAVFNGVNAFIETGDPQHLQPLAHLTAGEVTAARNLLTESAVPVPDEVIAILPEEVRDLARSVRVMEVSQVPGELNLPKTSINHLEQAGAIALIDVIVFKEMPGTVEQHDKHLWAHEMCHIRQYRDWGTTEFATRFAVGELSFKTDARPVNPIEDEADVFACKAYFVDKPGYLSSCTFALSPR